METDENTCENNICEKNDVLDGELNEDPGNLEEGIIKRNIIISCLYIFFKNDVFVLQFSKVRFLIPMKKFRLLKLRMLLVNQDGR